MDFVPCLEDGDLGPEFFTALGTEPEAEMERANAILTEMQLPRLPDIDCQAVKNFPVLLNTVISMARVVHEERKHTKSLDRDLRHSARKNDALQDQVIRLDKQLAFKEALVEKANKELMVLKKRHKEEVAHLRKEMAKIDSKSASFQATLARKEKEKEKLMKMVNSTYRKEVGKTTKIGMIVKRAAPKAQSAGGPDTSTSSRGPRRVPSQASTMRGAKRQRVTDADSESGADVEGEKAIDDGVIELTLMQTKAPLMKLFETLNAMKALIPPSLAQEQKSCGAGRMHPCDAVEEGGGAECVSSKLLADASRALAEELNSTWRKVMKNPRSEMVPLLKLPSSQPKHLALPSTEVKEAPQAITVAGLPSTAEAKLKKENDMLKEEISLLREREQSRVLALCDGEHKSETQDLQEWIEKEDKEIQELSEFLELLDKQDHMLKSLPTDVGSDHAAPQLICSPTGRKRRRIPFQADAEASAESRNSPSVIATFSFSDVAGAAL